MSCCSVSLFTTYTPETYFRFSYFLYIFFMLIFLLIPFRILLQSSDTDYWRKKIIATEYCLRILLQSISKEYYYEILLRDIAINTTQSLCVPRNTISSRGGFPLSKEYSPHEPRCTALPPPSHIDHHHHHQCHLQPPCKKTKNYFTTPIHTIRIFLKNSAQNISTEYSPHGLDAVLYHPHISHQCHLQTPCHNQWHQPEVYYAKVAEAFVLISCQFFWAIIVTIVVVIHHQLLFQFPPVFLGIIVAIILLLPISMVE